MNLAFVIILASVLMVLVCGTMIGIKLDDYHLFGILVYAQNSTNKTSLPIPGLEPVEPVEVEGYNITALGKSNNTEYLQYEDSDLGFGIEYPADWTINNDNTQYHTVVSFDSPEKDATVDIRIFPKGDYKSLKDYGDKEFKESNDITLLNYYRNSSTLLSGKPALKAIYLSSYNPSIFENAFGYKSSTSKAMMVATMVPEKKSIYALAYFAQSPTFDDYFPVVNKMLNSFKINAKGPTIQEDNGDENSTVTSKNSTISASDK